MNSLEQVVYPALDVVNGLLPPGEGVKKDPGSVLFGLEGGLDSINLVNFIVVVEERFHAATGRNLSLMNPEVMVMEEFPFSTLGSLAAYIDRVSSEPAQ
jgi:acyl carrier protein